MAFENPFKKLSKPEIYASIAGGVGIGGYFVIRHHSKTGTWNPWASGGTATSTGGTNAGAATGSGTDPITGLPYSDDDASDPLTGQQYLAEANQYGSVAAAEAAVTAYGQSTATGSGIPVNPASPVSQGSVNTVAGTTVYTSNAAWAQAATAGLTDVGYNGTDVATALGLYLTQQPETPAQIALTNTAIAEYGAAPVGSLQVIQAPTSGNASTVATTSGGRTTSVTQTTATLTWTGNQAASYKVTLVGPGSKNGNVQTVKSPTVSYTGLEAGHNYSIQVEPFNAAGQAGQVGTVDFQTLTAGGAK